ncbi:late exocytosis, associated with Golgi transport-domain-containing protein, partial [Piptocephalis cylindrospora]
MATITDRSFSPSFVGLATQVGLSGGITAACIIGFEVLRRTRYFAHLYSPRCRLSRNATPAVSGRFLSWIPATLALTEEFMVSHAGLEAVMHLRFLKTSALLLAIASVPIAATLLPLNYTRKAPEASGLDVDLFSINTIPDGSKELYVHGFLTYVFSFLVLFVFYRDSLRYIELHREFGLRQVERGSRASRTIMISRLPRNLRSDEALNQHFSSLGVGEVEDAVILRYPAKLVRKLARREKALRSLEDAHMQLARNVLSR